MDFWLYLARRTAHTAATLILLLVFMYTLFRLVPVVVLALLIGISAGSWLGWRRGGRAEEIGALVALIPRALPVFWIGIVLLMLFAYQLQWFPIAGMRESFFFPNNAFQAL